MLSQQGKSEPEKNGKGNFPKRKKPHVRGKIADKILFIVPPSIEFEDFANPGGNTRTVQKQHSNYGSALTDIPLGVLSLSAYVKKYAAAKTRLIDFNVVLNKIDVFEARSFLEFFRYILSLPQWMDYTPTIIGISALFSTSYQNMLDIAQCCCERFPNAVIVAGGAVPTNMYTNIFRDSLCLDALCYGEGEKPLLGLVKADNKFQHLDESPTWITRKKVEDGQLFQHDMIEDLDEIPPYDYELCREADYRLNPTIACYPMADSTKRHIQTMTSRGCPHHCCYCSAHTIHGRKVRYYSIQRVKNDLAQLKKEGIEMIIFQDDHFLFNRKRTFEILDTMVSLGLTAFWPNALTLYALDHKMLNAMKRAGMKQLVMAIESGSSRVLREIMHKPINLSIIKRVSDDCRELGIFTDASIIIGLPGETKQDIEDARSFLKTLDVNWFRFYAAVPLAGSEMFQICQEKGYLPREYTSCNFKKASISTEHFSAEYIQKMIYVLNLDFNFAHNSDFRLGNYEMALNGFKNAIRAKNDHAIAYYYAAKCYEKLGNKKKARQYINSAKMNAEKPFWREYIDMFNIPL
ncbi:radical SAM protein [Patescibacteria group bacterium]|nr:radical SAM protein [Patescibacteria group bacterium]